MQRPTVDQMKLEEKIADLRVQYGKKENASRRDIIQLQSRILIRAWEKLMKRPYQKPLLRE